MWRRTWSRLKEIWRRAKSEHATPRQIAFAVGVGVFCGCTPAVGFHGWVAVGAATLLRLNRLWSWLGSRISNMLILPFIVYAEIDLAHFLRTGETIVFDRHHVLGEAHLLLLDWCIGAVLVGAALGTIFGAIAYVVARLRRKPAPDPSPSSESRPSG